MKVRIRNIGIGGHVARMAEMRNAYIILDGKPEGKRPLGRPSCRSQGKREGRCGLDASDSG